MKQLKKKINFEIVDVYAQSLPYPNNYFDMVVSFGVFDYFPTFDNPIKEIYRVLKPEGICVISLPNLASWHNRIALLLGYQPRDIEVSYEILVGVFPYYRKRGDKPVGHIHTLTANAFKELMEFYHFKTIRILGFGESWTMFNILDKLFEHFPNLAKRFIYIGKK